MVKLVNQVGFASRIKEKRIFIFSANDIRALFGVSAVAASALLHRYKKIGFILQIKRGLYAFPDNLPPDAYIANKLYSPSYISFEFALSYHGVIPETVYETQKQRGVSFYIASAEKAFVDANYLRLTQGQKPISRFNKDKINYTKALKYAFLFGNAKLISIIKTTLR